MPGLRESGLNHWNQTRQHWVSSEKETSKGQQTRDPKLRGKHFPISVYKDSNTENNSGNQSDLSTLGLKSWDSLPTHRDRNKENTAITSKWTSFKVLQRPGARIAVSTAPTIEVFVDEPSSDIEASECSMSSPNECAMKRIDKTERASRPITRAYSRKNSWNSSLQESMKLDRAQLGHSKKNCTKNECRKFSLCEKRRNLEAFNEEKATVDGSDKNEQTFKCIYKRRRIQASRDSLDCL